MKIGTEEFNIHSESKQLLDVEIVLLNITVYIVVFTYAFDYLSWPVFYLLFHLFYMRFFMGNHDRFHADTSKRWPRPIELFTEYFGLMVTPWDEPYDSIRQKHFSHHKSHLPNKTPGHNMLQDPHSVYEAGGFWRSLFYSTFYEEVQLIIDIRNKNITKSRLIRTTIYLPLMVLFFMVFGWEKYLGVFIAVRLMSTTSWFFFSWFIHTYLYKFGAVRKIPKPVLFLFGLMNGKRVNDGFVRHTSHHAWPYVPSNKLYELDAAVMRNVHAMPKFVSIK